jgi:hypothetical protein
MNSRPRPAPMAIHRQQLSSGSALSGIGPSLCASLLYAWASVSKVLGTQGGPPAGCVGAPPLGSQRLSAAALISVRGFPARCHRGSALPTPRVKPAAARP